MVEESRLGGSVQDRTIENTFRKTEEPKVYRSNKRLDESMVVGEDYVEI